MRNSIKITISVLIATLFSTVGMHVVNAGGGCTNPGPYGICLPDTAISTESIPTTIALALLALFVIGSLIYITTLIWEQQTKQ